MDEKIIDILKNVEGISISDGLKYCGSSAAYAKFIKSFYTSIDKKALDIEKAYESEDYALYTTKVHSLKSTSRIAGMAKLSELALKLEEAGRAGNTSFIKEKHDEFIKFYRSFNDKLSVLDEVFSGDDKDAKPISASELEDAYKSLSESIEMMDYDAVELILGEVTKYKLPKEDKAVMNSLDSHLKNMEWEEMSELIQKKG